MRKLCLLLVVITHVPVFFSCLVVGAAESPTSDFSDMTAPLIKRTLVVESVPPGSTLTIEAFVSDNVGIKDVSLFYRSLGNGPFESLTMTAKSGSENYMATLPEISVVSYEYYILAVDYAGNINFHGHSLSPLIAMISSSNRLQNTKPAAGLFLKLKNSKVSKWVWTRLGELAALLI